LTAEQFSRRIDNFLSEMSFFGYMGRHFFESGTDGVSQKMFNDSVARLDQWLTEVKAQLAKAG